MSTFTSVAESLFISVNEGELRADVLEALTSEDSNLKECEVFDFKRDIPITDYEYSKLYKDMVCLHNTYGGFIVFGIQELEKDTNYKIVGVENNSLEHGKIRDNLQNLIKGELRFNIKKLECNSFNIEYIWISKRQHGTSPLKFSKNSPELNGKSIYKKGEVPFRRLDTNITALTADDYDFLHSSRTPPVVTENNIKTEVFKPLLENNLPDRSLVCSDFIGRDNYVADLWRWVDDEFSRVKLIAGEGGLGKTSLAYYFAERISRESVKPFLKVVWLSAKQKQFVALENSFKDALSVDYDNAKSLLISIYKQLGGTPPDYEDLEFNELASNLIDVCNLLPSFIVIDDVDSLPPEEQKRVLEFGLMARSKSKFLITTRINLAYSPDTVLKLNGFQFEEYTDYVAKVRRKYGLSDVKESKLRSLHSTTSGSPLFTDSLFRLELRGLSLDEAITRWKEDNGQEVRKAALQREVKQLSKYAKRILYVISNRKNCSTTEIRQYLSLTEQSLGDAIQELSSLFLINAPLVGKDTRYTIDANTARLVIEIKDDLEIDHSAIENKLKSQTKDAIGLAANKRYEIAALAISEANAHLRENNSSAALETINIASKRLTSPHPDLLLAAGRYHMAAIEPNFSDASKSFLRAYEEGCRKPLLYELWFKAEFHRNDYDVAIEVARKAILNNEDLSLWYERSAEVHIAIAHKSFSNISSDTAVRELDSAIDYYRKAFSSTLSKSDKLKYDRLIGSCETLKIKLRSRERKSVINPKSSNAH